MTVSDPIFREYVLKHVLQWEGTTSKDPDDTAAPCAPSPGAYHTNKGVTFCTFKQYAASFGMPVTYNRFLNLTSDDIIKFAFAFCQACKADQLPPLVSIAVTEAAWGSGPERAIKHLQATLNKMGNSLTVDGAIGSKTLTAAKAADPTKLYQLYWIERKAFIANLSSQPKYAKYKNGWANRINSFLARFPIGKVAAVATGGLALGVGFFLP